MRPGARVRLRDGEALVEATGPLDGRAAAALAGPVNEALACRPPRLCIDLRRATRADATTARLVARIAERAAAVGTAVEVRVRGEHAALFVAAPGPDVTVDDAAADR